MKLRTHVWTSALTGLAIYPRQPRRALVLLLAGVLIDLDHYVLYAWRSGDWSLHGALAYASYRGLPRGLHDQRPRYGSLRSMVHHPAVGLALGAGSVALPGLRPLAIGVALHLTLDWLHLVRELPVRLRAGWRCQVCGRRRRLHVHLIKHRLHGGRYTPDNLAVLCGHCLRVVQEIYPVFPPPQTLDNTISG